MRSLADSMYKRKAPHGTHITARIHRLQMKSRSVQMIGAILPMSVKVTLSLFKDLLRH